MAKKWEPNPLAAFSLRPVHPPTPEAERRALNPRLQGDFPVGGGELGKLIRAFDWSKTELGPIESWSPALRTATNIVLQSPLPLVMLRGKHGIMIYNDAYSADTLIERGVPFMFVTGYGAAGVDPKYRDQVIVVQKPFNWLI
jgi:hypothetical protein